MAVFASRQIVMKYPEKMLGDYAVGESVFLNVNGYPKEFIVVNHGNPDSTIYGSGCNGTWLLMKDVYTEKTFDSTSNDYKESSIKKYLDGTTFSTNNTVLSLFDDNIQSIVKSAYIPYVSGGGKSGSVTTMKAKLFLLSAYEVGFTTSSSNKLYVDGSALEYFNGADNERRIAYYGGFAFEYWTRSPVNDNSAAVVRVSSDGSMFYSSTATPYNDYGVRPALILPSTAKFYSGINTFTGVS